MLLALDTATPAVTVAVADGDRVLAERTTVAGRRHGELLAPAVESVLREAGVERGALDRVAVGVGPGPFTGLRVGLVTARTLGAVLDRPVVGVCTLDVLALMAVEDGVTGPFRVVADALRREVHWATYDTDDIDDTDDTDVSDDVGGTGDTDVSGGTGAAPRRVDGPHVDRPADVAWDGPAVGAGAATYGEHFTGAREPQLPTAAAMCRWVARGLPLLEPEPLYLRRPDAVEPAARKPVS